MRFELNSISESHFRNQDVGTPFLITNGATPQSNNFLTQ